MHKVQDGAGTLALEAQAGQSLRVTRLRVNDPTAALNYVEPTIDRKTVGYFRASAAGAAADVLMNNVAATPRQAVNIFDQLKARDIPLTFPVAEGQVFRVPGLAAVIIDVEYDVFDAADVKADEMNGTDSDEFMYIERGTNAAVVAIGVAQYALDLSITPVEFPNFPFSGVVAAGRRVELHGIIGQPVAVCDATPAFNGATERLLLLQEREVIGDEDRAGLLFRGDGTVAVAGTYYTRIASVIGHNLDTNDLPLFFDPPLHFGAGEELNVIVTFGAVIAATAIPANTLDVGFILKEVRV